MPFAQQTVGRFSRLMIPGLALALAGCGGIGVSPPPASVTVPAPSSAASLAAGPVTGRLLYSRFNEETHTFVSTHTALADGSDEVEVPLPGPEGGGRWSRSGTQIAVMTVRSDERIGTAVITPDGTVDHVLEIPDDTLNLVCVVWSPDDSRLACEAWDETDASRSGIYTVRSSDGGDLQRLTTAPDGVADLPGDYSPDGTQFVFMRTVDEAAGSLMTVNIDGGEPRPLSTVPYEDSGRFAPDGASVLTSANGRIVILDLDGEVLQTLDEPGAYLFGPAWSPDGTRIAFSSASGGPFADIFTSLPDGTARQQVTSTPANEITVDWGSGGG